MLLAHSDKSFRDVDLSDLSKSWIDRRSS